MKYPEWVLAHKAKGREIKKIGDRYYLYEVSSQYDKTQKVTRKRSGSYLGRITESGLIAKGGHFEAAVPRRVSVKEYGASSYVVSCLSEEYKVLQAMLPDYAAVLLVCAVFRLLYRSAFKQMDWHYGASYLSEQYPNLKLSGKAISGWLGQVGEQREVIAAIMRKLSGGEAVILIDNTHITTQSKQNLSAQLGYNSERKFDTQVNLLYLFAHDTQMPVFYRCVQGSVREVRAARLTLQESGIRSAVLVADKGFHSANNVSLLDDDKWQYVLPIRRSSNLCNYDVVRKATKTAFDGYFMHEQRVIWYKVLDVATETTAAPLKRRILFLDERLKVSESSDYLQRIAQKKEGYTLELFHEKEVKFGCIIVLTNTFTTVPSADTVAQAAAPVAAPPQPLMPPQVFELLKSRNDIEQLYDNYKNVLEADKTYMRSDVGLETWHFINFLALRAYYRILKNLQINQLNSKFSPQDALLLLQTHKKVRINNEWIDAEIPKKAQDLIKALLPQPKKS